MVIVPNSYGVLREFNPCHNPEDGKFAVKGQGRCLGDAARLAARRDAERTTGIFSDSKAVRATRLLTADEEDERKEVEKLVRARRGIRLYIEKHPPPAYMRKDIQRALRGDAALTMVEPPVPHTRTPGTANITGRVVHIDPRPGDSRAMLLSVLRHEHGHIDRTPLGRGGSTLNGVKLDARQTEEIRAWKNAIRNSEGKVSSRQMAWALGTYFRDHPSVIERTFKATATLDVQWKQNKPTRTEAIDALNDLLKGESQAFVNDRIMPAMRRYQRRVRRASRGLQAA